MKKILIQIVLIYFPIVINCQDFKIYQGEVLDAINELRTVNNLSPVNKEEKLSKILEEIIIPSKPLTEDQSKLVSTIDSTQLYHLFNENGIHDYNFNILDYTLRMVEKQEVKKYLQAHSIDIIKNNNIENIGIKISKDDNLFKIIILSTETYINFNELIKASLRVSPFDNTGEYIDMTITGSSKITYIKYVPLTTKEFIRSNVQSINTLESHQLKLKEDNTFEIKIELSSKVENKIQSFFITDATNKILSFYIIR